MTAATVAAPAYSMRFGNKLPNTGLTCQTLSHAWLTAETDEANDTVEFGYIPGGVTVIGFINKCADLDSHGSPTLTHTIKLGSTSAGAFVSVTTSGYFVTKPASGNWAVGKCIEAAASGGMGVGLFNFARPAYDATSN